ncbi:MAG: hypothetical protein AB7S86_19545 [Hydrogenophaga sp.]|uniref:hypothetical protein n=1 Tax=Hydrogenophaga sp. TaxID=1904254 RepID=UPI003D0AF34C
MKVPSRALLICTLGLLGHHAQAGTASADFDVVVNLESMCQLKNGPGLTLDFGNYTAFQTNANTATLDIIFECTREFGAAPDVSFDHNPGLNLTNDNPPSENASGEGVVAGLRYGITATNTDTVQGAAATATSDGEADDYTYTVSGTLPAGQPGSVAEATIQARQLIVTF